MARSHEVRGLKPGSPAQQQAGGRALALGHARSDDPAMIAGCLGWSGAFDDAMVKFAAAYADQTERDYQALVKAVKAGWISAKMD